MEPWLCRTSAINLLNQPSGKLGAVRLLFLVGNTTNTGNRLFLGRRASSTFFILALLLGAGADKVAAVLSIAMQQIRYSHSFKCLGTVQATTLLKIEHPCSV
jgi:hypothetical protein